ncbi:DUF1801 domain-containing protein [Nocardia sp. NPDC048505]|uniref:iron chaperone n=1 Tax=unclassified Nocardia TaxID=2637762 RepID=UPI0033D1457A
MTATEKASVAFSAEERAAMREHSQELKTAARRGAKASKADGESDVLAKLAEMSDFDRTLGERVHALVKAAAPELIPKLWYGMPAYADATGKIVCFYQCSDKFKARYATFGFNDVAQLDDGAMWPTAYSLTGEMTAADDARLSELVRRALG